MDVSQVPVVNPAKPLAGQVAIVTGGGRGIGAAIAKKLASLGAAAVLCGRNATDLQFTADEIVKAGGRVEVVPCDVTDLRSFEYAAARLGSSFRRTEILVNHAGVGSFNDPLHLLPPA